MHRICLLVIASTLGFGLQSHAEENYKLSAGFLIKRCTISDGPINGCLPVAGGTVQQIEISLSCSSDGNVCQGSWSAQPLTYANMTFKADVSIRKNRDQYDATLTAHEDGDVYPVVAVFEIPNEGPVAVLNGAKVVSPTDPEIFYVPMLAIVGKAEAVEKFFDSEFRLKK